jgi:hypothetical protein
MINAILFTDFIIPRRLPYYFILFRHIKKKNSNQMYNRNVAVKFIMCFNIQGREGHI